MIGRDHHAHTERYARAELHWTNHVDAAGSRIEWRITTDHEGWACSYGPVHNAGISCGSRAISSQAEEAALLAELRARASGVQLNREIGRQAA
ncbi:hypothetical protein [Xylophilus sp. GOD-11R]|uniref:hypothetical protein n=1 Tax=Xylophilus sp. GOD-11R TaxID=3089814 RepID=UPI00298D4B95|nr:hypothetical protein [Xylophilus sp. GOD-11R]WPB58046.1 hypothetical protein R9X41_05235 [Xylophilus sp. GOD-11R]